MTSELLRRLEARDHTLWPEGNVAPNRLGWLDMPRRMLDSARTLKSFAASVDQDTIVLLGMGGSSLGPAVLAAVRDNLGTFEGRRVVVCDTTDPSTVAGLPLEDAFIIVSSKSGTTLEPNVLFSYARSRVADPSRYAVVTDPGTPLGLEAAELGIRHVFENQPDIGGRYSVLSFFGLVPAALMGYDVAELCERALDADREQAVALGAEMGEAALHGRDKTTIVVGQKTRSFGLWVEQLIAESTGKQGRGCVPVPTTENETGDDRHTVGVTIDEPGGLGEEFFRFELAVAICGHALSIDPFDEPNVAESKANTLKVLGALPLPSLEASAPGDLMALIAAQVRPHDYVSLQAYLPFGQDEELEALRRRVRDANAEMAVTVGYGPRFLHSTGQLHKGGPNSVVAVQLVRSTPSGELSIPGETYDFPTLIEAQSIGDHQSLVAHNRRVIRVELDRLGEIG
ncbi:MAG: glucose-6-phosphate isomerase [Acidimicrobiales bacterium]